MKTLYLECNMGAAGDMLTAALLDLFPAERQNEFLRIMNTIPGVQVTMERKAPCGVQGCHVTVLVNGEEEHSHDVHHDHTHAEEAGHDHEHDHEHDHDHEHHHEHDHEHDHEHHHEHEHGHDHDHAHHHHHAGMDEIQKLIGEMPVSDAVKRQAMYVYSLIAQAESKAHGVPVEQVHFHEVGALDAVVDVTGACLLLSWLAPERVVVSPIHLGSGQVRCAHGILPVPAPATANLLEGVPCYTGSILGELCTPTGAALVRSIAQNFGPMPVMTIQKVGIGTGNKEFAQANILRAFWGESTPELRSNQVVELSCNIDDMSGEELAFASERLLAGGALDVYTLPMQMKKGRPAVMLCCLCEPSQQAKLAALMLQHTTSWGVRMADVQRLVLPRKFKSVKTPYGPVRVKYSEGPAKKAKVEYSDAAALALAAGVPLAKVEQAAMQAFDAEQNTRK